MVVDVTSQVNKVYAKSILKLEVFPALFLVLVLFMRRETSGLVFKFKVAAFVASLRVHLGVLVSSAPSEHTLRVAQFRISQILRQSRRYDMYGTFVFPVSRLT